MKDWSGVVLFLVLAFALSCGGAGTPPGSAGQAGNPSQAADVLTLSYEERQGMQVFMKFCAVCHGKEGKGDGFNSYNLDPKPRDLTDSTYMKALSNSRLTETIVEGGRGVNKSPLMPSWGATLSKDEIQYLLHYVRTLGTATKSDVPQKHD
jgi:cytochrome c oxidase cbb3-type subunit 3